MNWGRVGRVAAVVVPVAVVLAGVGWVGYYRYTYGTFAWWDVPVRLHYCGRTYIGATHSETMPAMPDGGSYVPAFTVEPGGWQVYAAKSPGPPPQEPTSGPPDACTTVLTLRHSNADYVTYDLSGGP